MSFNTTVIPIMICSPTDVTDERKTVVEAIYSWNDTNSRNAGVVLLPVRWETHAIPGLGDRGQALINKQCLESSDILIAVFGDRLGTPTSGFESGTVEEIHTAREQHKEVMIYFPSDKRPLTRTVLRNAQVDKVEAYKETVTGLYWTYDDCAHLKQEVMRHLTSKLHEMNVFENGKPNKPNQDLQDVLSFQPPLFESLLGNSLMFNGDGAWLHIIADIGQRVDPFDSPAKQQMLKFANQLYLLVYNNDPPTVERLSNPPIFSKDYVSCCIPEDDSRVLRLEFKQDVNTGVFRIQFRNNMSKVPLEWIITRLFVASQEVQKSFNLKRIGFAISNLPSDGIATEPLFTCVIGGNRPGAHDSWCSDHNQPINLEESIKNFLYQFFDKWGYLGFEEPLAALQL